MEQSLKNGPGAQCGEGQISRFHTLPPYYSVLNIPILSAAQHLKNHSFAGVWGDICFSPELAMARWKALSEKNDLKIKGAILLHFANATPLARPRILGAPGVDTRTEAHRRVRKAQQDADCGF